MSEKSSAKSRMPDDVCTVLLCMLAAMVLYLLGLLDGVHCVLLCMLGAVKGVFYMLEAVEGVYSVLEVVEGARGAEHVLCARRVYPRI
jgi:hypothetical protein